MTKQELLDIVNRVFHLWNHTPPATNQKDLYEAWWAMLHDLDAPTVAEALTALSALDTYMPRPGTLRRATLERTGLERPPSPMEAWQTARAISLAINNGTYEPAPLHPALAATIASIGVDHHTNGDREQFLRTYDHQVEQWQLATYTPPPL